jgi:hypothetical protein
MNWRHEEAPAATVGAREVLSELSFRRKRLFAALPIITFLVIVLYLKIR